MRKEAYKTLPKQIQSKHGYEGCLGSLDLNGESPNVVVEALIPSNQVVKGCEGEIYIFFLYFIRFARSKSADN